MRAAADRSPISGYGIFVADTIEKIHQRSRGTYGKRRIRAELLDTYEMNVKHKLVSAIMTELGIAGLPRPGKRKPNLLGVETLSDRVNRGFTTSRPNELWFTDINELWFTDITEHAARDGKVYCCAILDCFSKMIVGRSFPRLLIGTGQQCGEHGRAGTDPLGGNDRIRGAVAAPYRRDRDR